MKEELEKYHLDSNKVNKENSKFILKKTELFFDGIFLNDIILKKDFSRLEEQLDKFYSINSFTYNDYKNRNIKKILDDNNYRWKVFLPMISSKDHSFHKNKELPEDIDFIQINLGKVCLDYISIDIIFYFNEKVNISFNNEFKKIHKPEIIESINDSKLQLCNIFSVKDIKKREIKKFIDSLRKESLIFILKYLDLWELYFLNDKDYFNNLPSLNIFSFKWEKQEILENRDLLDVINFSYNDIQTFIYDDKYYLYWENKNYTLLINWDKFENFKIDFSPYWILLDFNLSYISILEYFISLDLKIDKISHNILNNISDFKKISVEKQKLIDKTIIFDRLSWVFEWLLLDNTDFIRLITLEKCDNNFDKINIEIIKNFILKKSLLINKTILNINSLFELKNTTENMKLQNSMKFWTIIMTFLTVFMFIFVFIQLLLIKVDDNNYFYNFIVNFLN